MLRIVGRTSSINVRKVLWTLDEIGLAYDHEDAEATPGMAAKSASVQRLNPNATVPALEDEAGPLWESNTICRYLAHKHGRADLLPADPRGRAEVEVWMDWQAAELNVVWRPAFFARVRKDPAFPDGPEVEASFKAWTGKMKVLEDQLAATGAYAVGQTFTLADVLMGLSVHRYFATPGTHAPFPASRAYLTRLAERPAFQRYASPATP